MEEREAMVDKLHATHLETEGMKRLCRKKFWWPKYGKDLEACYKSCVDCKTELNSKVHKPEVIPEDLTMLTPGEEITMDFASYGSRKFLVIKDCASG